MENPLVEHRHSGANGMARGIEKGDSRAERRMRFVGPPECYEDRRSGTGLWRMDETRWVAATKAGLLLQSERFRDLTPPTAEFRASLPTCTEPGCDRKVFWHNPDEGLCYMHRCMELDARRKLNRRMGRCGCGAPPMEGFKTCAACRRLIKMKARRYRLRKRLRSAEPEIQLRSSQAMRDLRRRRGLSLGRLAERSGVSRRTLERIEAVPGFYWAEMPDGAVRQVYRSAHRPRPSTLRRLLDVLEPTTGKPR